MVTLIIGINNHIEIVKIMFIGENNHKKSLFLEKFIVLVSLE